MFALEVTPSFAIIVATDDNWCGGLSDCIWLEEDKDLLQTENQAERNCQKRAKRGNGEYI